jgi:hypothetical protein
MQGAESRDSRAARPRPDTVAPRAAARGFRRVATSCASRRSRRRQPGAKAALASGEVRSITQERRVNGGSRMSRSSRCLLCVLGVFGVVVVVCTVPALARANSRLARTRVSVTIGKPAEFRFTLSKARIPKGTVGFAVTKRGTISHDLKSARARKADKPTRATAGQRSCSHQSNQRRSRSPLPSQGATNSSAPCRDTLPPE